jgi:hypothetical protein
VCFTITRLIVKSQAETIPAPFLEGIMRSPRQPDAPGGGGFIAGSPISTRSLSAETHDPDSASALRKRAWHIDARDLLFF